VADRRVRLRNHVAGYLDRMASIEQRVLRFMEVDRDTIRKHRADAARVQMDFDSFVHEVAQSLRKRGLIDTAAARRLIGLDEPPAK
jgi:hypothetical protein